MYSQRWPMSPLQQSLPPWLKRLVTPLLITNLKPRISANTTFTTSKLKFAPEDCFLLKFFWFTPNDLTNKLRILLSVKDHAKFVFSWPTWAVYGFAIATKGSKPYGRERIYYHGSHILRNVVGGLQKTINFILNFFPSLPKENMKRKLGEWARDTSLDLLSICLSRSFVLLRFEFYLRWQKSHVYTVCICSGPAGFPPLPYGDQSLLFGT